MNFILLIGRAFGFINQNPKNVEGVESEKNPQINDEELKLRETLRERLEPAVRTDPVQPKGEREMLRERLEPAVRTDPVHPKGTRKSPEQIIKC